MLYIQPVIWIQMTGCFFFVSVLSRFHFILFVHKVAKTEVIAK